MSRRAGALAGVAALVLTGCGVSMPESGPVVERTTTTTSRDDGSVNINPRRPGKGDSPEQIVRGFLDAMQATPAVKTSVAREFLTREARADWQPPRCSPAVTTAAAAERARAAKHRPRATSPCRPVSPSVAAGWSHAARSTRRT